MKPITTLIFCTLFVTSACKLPGKPREANRKIVKDIISQAAEDSLCPKVTPALLKAVTKVESQNNPKLARFERHYFKKISGTWDELRHQFEDSVSHGKTQIMGKTARAYGVEPEELRRDDATAYSLAALILGKEICGAAKGDIKLGVVAYNAGPDWRKKAPKVKAQAFSHAEKVMKEYWALRS